MWHSFISRRKSPVVLLLLVLVLLNGCSQAAPTHAPPSQTKPPVSVSNPISVPNPSAHFFYAGSAQDVTADGASGNFSQPKPSLSPNDAHTLAEVWVGTLSRVGQTQLTQQAVEVGWSVDRTTYHDDIPHLFVYYWVDGVPKCPYYDCGNAYNSVTTAAAHKPGAAVVVDGNPDTTHQFAIRYRNGGWWIYYDTEWIGYFLGTLWNNTFTQVGYVSWFGEVSTYQSVPCSQMGTGLSGTSPGAARISNMFLFIKGQQITADAEPYDPTPQYYSYGNALPWSISYGGPGATKQCAQNCPAPLVFPSGSTTQCTMPTPGTITEFASPSGASSLRGITAGPDGNLWFTEASAIGRITPAGQITEFPLPTRQSVPWGITKGPDGNLWFTESFGNNVGYITPTGQAQEFPVGFGTDSAGITAGPDGNLWYIDNTFNRIGQITLDGHVTEFPVTAGGLYEIAVGPDGNFWFTAGISGLIERMTPEGQVTVFHLPSVFSGPIGITAGPDGNLWFTEFDGNKIGRITPDGQITEFPIPTPGTQPYDITTGPDGTLWFTQQGSNQIGSMTLSGQVTEFSIPTPNSVPSGITAGPGNTIWFTEAGGKVGRLTLGT